ncbi:hypothetical protein OIU85_004948 [Salix viminalis]|uniref:Uncharacterized protein n=1 Tax=Salix viminalis TaxID=40686 RepID=A0A9Q0PTM8_SALVM|nr:hypothetical protein OIU85_004948 [Salix viminalis]
MQMNLQRILYQTFLQLVVLHLMDHRLQTFMVQLNGGSVVKDGVWTLHKASVIFAVSSVIMESDCDAPVLCSDSESDDMFERRKKRREFSG